MTPILVYALAGLVGVWVCAAGSVLRPRPLLLMTIAILTTLWATLAGLAVYAHGLFWSQLGFLGEAMCWVATVALILEKCSEEEGSMFIWVCRIVALMTCLVLPLGNILKRPFMSSLGWLMAPGPLAPLLPIITLALLGLAVMRFYQRQGGASLPRPWMAHVGMAILAGTCVKDSLPLFFRQPLYLPSMPVGLAAMGLGTAVYWARARRDSPEDQSVAENVLEVDATTEPEVRKPLSRRSDERFRVLMEHSSDSVLILSPDGSIHYHSPSLRRMLGQQTRYIPGISFLDFVHPDDRQTLEEALKQVGVADGRSTQLELRMQRRREEWSHMQGWATNLLANPDIGGIVLNLKDVSDARRLELQLSQAQKMEAIGRLAGGVAHDFNNLLTAITGYTDMLLRAVPPATEEYEYLCQIHNASDRAAALTQQLLAFSRQKTMQQEPLSVTDVLDSMQDMLRRIIGEDVVLKLHLGVTAPIMADPTQIQQIILNLAVNSRDAMPRGGQLTIETSSMEAPANLPWVRPNTRYVRISVRDTGQGMSQEVRAHMFEPFFTTKGVGKGTGLGLSTVYGIVEQGGGHIEVDSVVEHGTTFTIYLPQIEGPAGQPVPAPPKHVSRPQKPPLLPSRRETLLLVEDDDTIRRLAERILKAKGYQLLVANNGAEAVKLSEAHPGPVHLMLTDVVMPVMNGVELAERLGVARPDMRVVFMSGYVPEEANAGNGLQGRTIQKPFTADSLVSKIQEALKA